MTPRTRAIAALMSGVLVAGCCLVAAARPQTAYKPSYGPFLPVVVPTPTPSPSVAPEPTAKPTPKPTRKPKPQAQTGTALRGGKATWYCCTRGYGRSDMVAAAGAELRVGDWRGRRVRVCGGGDCITVTLVDWCLCSGTRIIDLHPTAFSRLAPLSRGVIKVTVEW